MGRGVRRDPSGLLEGAEIAAELVFGAVKERLDRRDLAVEDVSDVCIAHALVITENQRNAVAIGQAVELLADPFLLFAAQHDRERRRRRVIGHGLQAVFGGESGGAFALAFAQLVDAMTAGDLGNPGAKRKRFIALAENVREFEENFGGGVFGVLAMPEEAAADLEYVAVMRRVDDRERVRGAFRRPDKPGVETQSLIQK